MLSGCIAHLRLLVLRFVNALLLFIFYYYHVSGRARVVELHIASKDHITSSLNGLYFSMLLTTFSSALRSARWHGWSKHNVNLWFHKMWTLLEKNTDMIPRGIVVKRRNCKKPILCSLGLWLLMADRCIACLFPWPHCSPALPSKAENLPVPRYSILLQLAGRLWT